MITGVHTMVYSDDPEAARAFFRDVLGWRHVDAGGGWLIFATGPSELGVHPTSEGSWSTQPKHEITLMCDDLDATMAELADRGARFVGDVEDESFGRTVHMEVPGSVVVMVYQPKHPPAVLSD